MKKLSLFTILISLAMGVCMTASSQTMTEPASTNGAAAAPKPEKKAKETKAKEPAKEKTEKFTGKLGAVDKVYSTITLDEKAKRVFEVTSDTLITTNGVPAILTDAVVGSPVQGTYVKTADGKLSARLLNFGEKSEPSKAKAKTKKTPDSSTNSPAKT